MNYIYIYIERFTFSSDSDEAKQHKSHKKNALAYSHILRLFWYIIVSPFVHIIFI